MYYVNVISEFQDKTTNLYVIYRIYLIKRRIIKFLVFPMLPFYFNNNCDKSSVNSM